jgi:hypothetical protein
VFRLSSESESALLSCLTFFSFQVASKGIFQWVSKPLPVNPAFNYSHINKASFSLLPSQPAGPSVPSGHAGPGGQLPGETWKEFLTRQDKRRTAKLENDQHRKAREGRELTAAKKNCPGKKGPTVYIWEEENGVWTRTLLNRGEVEGYWGQYRSCQKLFNSFDNCWDLCGQFDDGTAREIEHEYDSIVSFNRNIRQSQRSPAPKKSK